MTRRYPTSIRFGGGFRVDCATASRSVRLTFAGCDHRIGRIQPALNDFWAIRTGRSTSDARIQTIMAILGHRSANMANDLCQPIDPAEIPVSTTPAAWLGAVSERRPP
jgi:hypothetical protein